MDNITLSARLAQLRIRHLTLLDLIAHHGSLSKVANALFVTQPAVTAMLQEMEATLGVTLVERDRQGARLTLVGVTVKTRLRLALNVLDGLEAGLKMAPAPHHLRVGVLTSALLELVPSAVALLRANGLEVTFQFIEDTAERVISGVLEGSIDCAIGRIGSKLLQSQQQHRVAISQIQAVPLQAVCAPDNPITRSRRNSLEALQKREWVLLPHGSQLRAAFDQAFLQQELAPPLPVAESWSFYSNFHLVNKTDLLTIAPSTALEYSAAANLVHPIKYIWPTALPPLMFFALKEMAEIDAIAAFKQAVFSVRAKHLGP